MEDEAMYITTGQIAGFIHKQLIEYGYVPVSDEVLDLADIFFDFLIDVGVMNPDDVEEDNE